jgi:ATP-dependent helicase/DNAse subunit B
MREKAINILTKSNTIVFMNQSDRIKYLKEAFNEHLLFASKILSFNDLSCEVDPIYYIFMKKNFGYGPAFSNKLISYFNYIDCSITYNNSKILLVQDVLKSLIEAEMIRFPRLNNYESYLKVAFNDKRIPGYLTDEIDEIFYDIKPSNKSLPLIECNTSTIQTMMCAEEIKNLILNEIPLDSIHVMNVDEVDEYQLSKWLKDAGIPSVYEKNTPIHGFKITKDFILEYKNNGILSAIELLQKNSKEEFCRQNQVIQTIFKVINQYGVEYCQEFSDIICYEIDHITLPPVSLQNVIHIYPEVIQSIKDDDYYLLLNYNDKTIPRTYKDDDYLSDKDKQDIYMETSIQKNILEKEHITNLIERMKNLKLFYVLFDTGKSLKVAELELSRALFKTDIVIDSENSYFKVMSYLQAHQNHSSSLPLIYNEYPRYDSKFNYLSNDTIQKYMNSIIKLSATSIEMFLQCPFRYFLKYILRISNHEDSFAIYYGNITHKILELITRKVDFELSELVYESRSYFPESEQYKFETYMPVLVVKLQIVINNIKKIRDESKFEPLASEATIEFLYPKDNRFSIQGKIDQIFVKTIEEQLYMSIVDYKTGNTSFKYDEFINKHQIQLLMYLYLVRKSKILSDFQVSGLYYQKVSIPKYKKEKDKDPLQKHFSYDGISLRNESVVSMFNSEENMRGITYKNDGHFKASNRLFDKQELDRLENDIDIILNDVTRKIVNSQFDITPFRIYQNTKISKSCEYCEYEAICYLKNKRTHLEDITEVGEDDE